MMFKQKRASDALNAFHKTTCHQRATNRGQRACETAAQVCFQITSPVPSLGFAMGVASSLQGACAAHVALPRVSNTAF